MGGSASTLARRIHARLPSRVRSERETRELLDRVRPYTMVVEPALRDLVGRVHGVLDAGVPGAFVECGTWRGGSSFLMAELAKRRGETSRKTWMFDSFEGLPPPQEIDGPGAKGYAEDTENPLYRDNCRAELEEVRATARQLDLEGQTEIVPGWFDQTLHEARERIGPIALLRIDCDWYEPVLFCLEALYDQVSPGGVLIVDDYYQWDGCTIATHEFLARRELPLRIEEAARIAILTKPSA